MKYWFLSLYLFLVNCWNWCKSIFGGNMDKEIVQSGEIIVVGDGEVKIDLGPELPSDIDVKFLHEKEIVPCNPETFDELAWDIVKHHHEHGHDYRLTIQWEVSEVRTIKWVAIY